MRNRILRVRVSDEELKELNAKSEISGIGKISTFIRTMSLLGEVQGVKPKIPKEITQSIAGWGRNFNALVHAVHIANLKGNEVDILSEIEKLKAEALAIKIALSER
ncbi:MAG TPA: hypothetical protein DD725_05625 [Deltaproteobacteria bacterium]|nr:hypothetical protein [Deltaproteobacteria bacterium]